MRSFVALVAFVLFASAAHAEPASPASIDALLKATRAEAMMEGMLVNVDQLMRQSMAKALEGPPLNAEQQRVLDAMTARMMKVMRDELAWSTMRPLYTQIYQETFTQEDIDGLLAFYGSSAGQAFVAKMPVVMQKSMALTQARMGPLMEKMKAAMQEAVEEAKRQPK